MKSLIACLLALFAAACGNDAPAPQTVQVPVQGPAAVPSAPAEQPVAAVVQAPRIDPNAELAAKVKKALEAASSGIAQGVDVVVENGVARLFGTVGSSKDRSAAEKIAASTPGVTSVENKLVVVRGS